LRHYDYDTLNYDGPLVVNVTGFVVNGCVVARTEAALREKWDRNIVVTGVHPGNVLPAFEQIDRYPGGLMGGLGRGKTGGVGAHIDAPGVSG
jgi:hypothetical protein